MNLAKALVNYCTIKHLIIKICLVNFLFVTVNVTEINK